MDQILWIGCLESDEEFKVKASKGYNLASAQVSQKNLLTGIEEISEKVIDSINGSVLPPYPVYKDRDIKAVIWSHANGSYDVSVGYRNDKYINRINCKQAMLTAAKKWCEKRYQGAGLTVFVYSMRSAPMAAACMIKKTIPNAKIYLIVTDLPQFMDLGQNRLKAFLKYIDWKIIKSMLPCFHGFILYTAKMADFLKLPSEKYLIMEGCCDSNEVNINNTVMTKKAIMYSGKLDDAYGIKMLLAAFMQIKDDGLELWLTGGGNAEKYILEYMKKDKRIKFLGFLPNRHELLRIQREASLLINMRLPSEPASDYCFPSKLFEYMMTGIPVLSFRLGGIPKEYYQYLLLIEDESVDALKLSIVNAIEMPEDERKKLGFKAQNFIKNNKTSKKQAERILTWIDKEHSVCQERSADCVK